MWENRDQENSNYRCFSRSDYERMTPKNCEKCINSSTFEDLQAIIQGNIIIWSDIMFE